ncbi:preprotein translocase subunit SecG [Candidatus Nomurabacteria bacterium RIFCSPLOWO2_01_FULL_36_10b]|uniref:Protein-export membrane protein SecG n=1 Tax=Candidatus Nomurabacteria bacterium RIFCSPLOWO2_01_FULL_36_10b TaxID=1801766 RepID=A0A1F6WPD0_9BACT|nr:MAG: preprotein translocase subunit SecG [Candidatus Nomurabacteria bacterium RIFCSPLOWO2_01_FULL_36_10b]
MDVLTIVQIVSAILLVICIILQRSGAGIEGALGGGSSYESVRATRRGFDKFIFIITIVIGVLFVAACAIQILLSR